MSDQSTWAGVGGEEGTQGLQGPSMCRLVWNCSSNIITGNHTSVSPLNMSL